MTTITIDRALLEQALEALEIVTDDYDDSAVGLEIDAIQALRAELAKPVESSYRAMQLAAMVLSDCGISTVCTTLHERVARRIALHEEQLIDNLQKLAKQAAPAWHDASEVAALKAERDELLAALKAMYSEAIRIRCSIHQKWLQIMNTASAAIAKAEGRKE